VVSGGSGPSFSGTAVWSSTGSPNWGTGANWNDFAAGGLDGAVPGLFGNTRSVAVFAGSDAQSGVNMSGVNADLSALIFSGGSNGVSYTLQPFRARQHRQHHAGQQRWHGTVNITDGSTQTIGVKLTGSGELLLPGPNDRRRRS